MDSMPFLHAEKVFNLIFEQDFTFAEIRAVLDHLLARDAFNPEVQAERGRYDVTIESAVFTVWVCEMDVIIKRM